PRAERVVRAWLYFPWQPRRLVAHVVGRKPRRPFGPAPHSCSAGPCVSRSANSNAVASRHAALFEQVEIALACIDENRAFGVLFRRLDDRGPETLIEFFVIDDQDLIRFFGI